MGYKHHVTDRNGKVHTRTSAERQYAYAVIRHWEAYTSAHRADLVFPAGSSASWCGRRDLADKQAASFWKYAHTASVEILPCTPVPTGKHKVKS